MRMLDALNHKPKANVRRPGHIGPISLRVSLWSAISIALMAITLGATLSAMRPVQDSSALVDVLSGGKHGKDVRTIQEHMDAWLTFSKDIVSVASGDEKVLTVPKETVGKKQIRLLPSAVGRTQITLTFADSTTEQLVFTVKRDLSVLEAALKSVHPSIEADIAPDRDAVVLTGNVPDGPTAARAAAAAMAYLSARGGKDDKGAAQVINLIRVQEPSSSLEQRLQMELDRLGGKNISVRRIQAGAAADDSKDVFIISGSAPSIDMVHRALELARSAIGEKDDRTHRLVNQLTTTDRPSSIEEVMERAIHEQAGCPKVKVSRVAQDDVSGDMDVLVLTGTVPTQTALVQTLTLASKVFKQQEIVKKKRAGEIQRVTETFAGGLTRTTETPLRIGDTANDIKVAADESGALHTGANALGGGLGSALRGVFQSGNQGSSNSGGGNSFGRLLTNLIDSNIGRAKALELADGRILSFIKVEDLPQVRVDIKLYDINRTALLAWDSKVNKLGLADFPTNGIDPNRVSRDANGNIQTNANGEAVLGHTNTDVAGVVSFLEGGFAGRTQIGGGHFALDALFNLLETEGIARELSSPSLTVLSGEVAAFGDGGSVPVRSSITTNVGVNDASVGVFSTVEQIEFGIQLAVRPLVDENGFITLDVVPSVSNPDFLLTRQIHDTTGSAQDTVAFAERSLRTSARLRDGETLLIGGLTDRSRKDQSSKTPGLANIPLLGWLFQDKSFEDKDRELVIAVNPVIVRDTIQHARLWAYPGSGELLPPTHHDKADAGASKK